MSGLDTTISNYIKDKLRLVDYSGSADYSSIINVNRQRKIQKQFAKTRDENNNGRDWFGRLT